MQQRISMVTLGVSDLPRARAFYEGLGWQGQEVDETVFYQAGPLALVLWGKEKLARDCGMTHEDGAGSSGFALAHNVRSRAEVDETIAAARQLGAFVTRPPAETFYGGYAGVFVDPDGHAWEVAFNPGFPLGDDGSITIPDLSG